MILNLIRFNITTRLYMKFTVDRKMLSDAIGNIIRAVSSKSTIPALEGILIKAYGNKIELTAYDLELGMKTQIDGNIIEEGKIVFSAKLFAEIVRKTPDNIISIETNDKLNANIVSGDSSFTIMGINSDEFPELPSVNSDNIIKISSELLKSMIRQTIFAIADDDTKPINKGSMFNFENNVFDLISVDGFRLAVRREKINMDINTNFVVPGKTLVEVLKIDCGDEIEMCCGRRHIMFKVGDYTIVSSILEGDFIDYKSALSINEKFVVQVKTRELTQSIERVSLLINEKLKSPIRCKFNEDNIELSCTTSIGKARDFCNCEISESERMEIGVNNKYFLDALRNSECDMVKLHIAGPLNPILITAIEGDEFMFLVLPVRLRNNA